MKRKTKTPKIIWKRVKATPEEVQKRLDRAFDILFTEVFKTTRT